MAYDIARALQSPNIVGNALVAMREGEAHGKQNRLADLASQAYTTPAEGRNNLLQQMAAIDPDSAAKQSQAFATMDANQKAQLAAGLDQFAHTAASIAQDPDEGRATAAYGQLIDKLASTGKDVSRFRSVPPKVGAQMALVQIASTKELLDQAGLGQSYTLSPGAARFTSDNRQVAAQPVALQYHDVPMGQGKAAGVFNPANGTLTPAAGGAPPAPAADPMQAIIAQANQAIQMGAPREQVEAWMMQQAQSAGLGPQPMGQGPGGNQLQTTQEVVPGPQDVPAQFGVGTPKPTAADRPPAGYQWNADHSGLEPIPGGPADKGSASVGLGDPNATGDSYLQTIPDVGMRNLIKGIAEGRVQVPRIYRSSKAGEVGATEIAAAVAQYDPSFNAQDFNSRNRTRVAFTSGRPYQDMTALNQVAQHIGHLAQQIDGTSGIAAPLGLGTLINKGVNAASDPYTGKVTAYQSTADAVAHETRKLFAGSSGGTLAELQSYIDMLKADNSTAQKKAALQNIAQLVQSRISILRQGYEQGMGKAGDPFSTTFPESARLLQQVAGDGGGEPAANVQTAPSAGVDDLLSKYGAH